MWNKDHSMVYSFDQHSPYINDSIYDMELVEFNYLPKKFKNRPKVHDSMHFTQMANYGVYAHNTNETLHMPWHHTDGYVATNAYNTNSSSIQYNPKPISSSVTDHFDRSHVFANDSTLSTNCFHFVSSSSSPPQSAANAVKLVDPSVRFPQMISAHQIHHPSLHSNMTSKNASSFSLSSSPLSSASSSSSPSGIFVAFNEKNPAKITTSYPSPNNKVDNKNIMAKISCRVCSKKANGIHYGVLTCESCKGFFRRAIRRKEPHKCVGVGMCHITPEFRSNCAACRYRKCLASGMSYKSIKLGRWSLKQYKTISDMYETSSRRII